MRAPSTQLRYLLDPASVAVIGATEDRNRVGGRPIHYLTRFGFRGAIYPVNPNRSQVQGLRCFPDLAALPDAPDLAVIAVGADRAADALRECARRGVEGAVVMASGFGETGEAGRQAERDLVAIARGGGVRLVGPNSQGLANFRTGAVTSFSTMFMEVAPADGPVAIVSQSGAAGVVPYALLRERGAGVRYVLATGNDADVTVSDLLGEVLDDADIRLVLLYLESIGSAERLACAAEKARRRGVPIVALKAGTGASGIRAARSHTGALATEDAAVGAFFRRHGIWRATALDELASAAPLYLGGRRTGRGRLLMMSHSGGVGVVCADMAERLGIPVADLNADTTGRLGAILPPFGSARNPVDLTAGLLRDGAMFGKALSVLADDPHVDLIHISVPVAGEGYDVEGFARSAARVGDAAEKPVVVSGPQASVLEAFARQGVPTFRSDAEALRAIRQYTEHRRLLSRRLPARSPARPGIRIERSSASGLSEAESLALIARAGVPVVAHRACGSAEEARRAFRQLGGRCVVKACSALLPHKTERGLVWLDIRSESELERAYDACARRMGDLRAEGSVIVARMETGRRELVVGARRDPTFGPVALVGDGGRYVEALRDHELLVPPFSEGEVLEAIARLRIAPVLEGTRGEPPADREAVARAAVALAELMDALPEIESIDVNPLLVRTAGSGAVALDALVTLRARVE